MCCAFDNDPANAFESRALESSSESVSRMSSGTRCNICWNFIFLHKDCALSRGGVPSLADKRARPTLGSEEEKDRIWSATSTRSSVTRPLSSGRKAIWYSHFNGGDSSSVPFAVTTTSVSVIPDGHACVLPPRMPSHTPLVALFGFPLRISLIVKPLPIPSSTRSASRKFDFPLALVPMNKFTRPKERSTLRRLLKFSMTMRSITFNTSRSGPVIPRCRAGR